MKIATDKSGYNAKWADFIRLNPNATQSQILNNDAIRKEAAKRIGATHTGNNMMVHGKKDSMTLKVKHLSVQKMVK